MKTIKVEVCVCTSCVMNGAMDIMESIEGIAKLQKRSGEYEIGIMTNKMIGDKKHNSNSPLVKINDELLLKTDTETAMAKVIEITSKDVTI